MKIYQIDATGRKIGRVASEAAALLRGKRDINFRPHLLPSLTVEIINVGKLDFPERLQRARIKTRYSGYPGGLKTESWKKMMEKGGPAKPLRLAVWGMLPKNKLRRRMIARLTIKE